MIAVVGSCNVDFVVPVATLPAPGETVLGRDHLRTPGGKGANQSVAAARLGSEVAFVGCVGDDELAGTIRGALEAAGVRLDWLREVADTPSGIALITVAEDGENTIAVSPGANARLGTEDVAAAGSLLAEAEVTLIQLEIAPEVVDAATRGAGGRVVLNPAPARPLTPALLSSVDVLVPNRSELAFLTGNQEPSTLDDAVIQAEALTGPGAVVVTLGADGALVLHRGRTTHVPATPVEAVDTTGAGDAFCGALADGLARGDSLEDATAWAVRVAGISTTRWGAQSGMPTRKQAGGSLR
ncbi:ribokinase [Actinophytocola xanthii]|uniref:Ribokinase n=1 Tax=Actinophytocola xanthii TaxID=1912961 RepID=A0A1Q8CQV0_9PSEU|nr:ribokinase [Actinophytocola xanthii]OLF16736.1 ribokinase [Actinophytocola xanthii]